MTNGSSNGTAIHSPGSEIVERPKRRRFSIEEKRRILSVLAKLSVYGIKQHKYYFFLRAWEYSYTDLQRISFNQAC